MIKLQINHTNSSGVYAGEVLLELAVRYATDGAIGVCEELEGQGWNELNKGESLEIEGVYKLMANHLYDGVVAASMTLSGSTFRAYESGIVTHVSETNVRYYIAV